jgi:hypothetical protein
MDELDILQAFQQYKVHLILISYELGIIQYLEQLFIEFFCIFLRSS